MDSLKQCRYCNKEYIKGFGTYCCRTCCATHTHKLNPHIEAIRVTNLKLSDKNKASARGNITRRNKSDLGRSVSARLVASNRANNMDNWKRSFTSGDAIKRSAKFLSEYQKSDSGRLKSSRVMTETWKSGNANPYNNEFRSENGMSPSEKVFMDKYADLLGQYKYNPSITGSKFRPDFMYEDIKLIVEIDHPTTHYEEEDRQRDEFFLSIGYNTVRINALNIEDERYVREQISKYLR